MEAWRPYMSFVSNWYEEWVHHHLQQKLKEFDERDASLEEVDNYLAKYGYTRKGKE